MKKWALICLLTIVTVPFTLFAVIYAQLGIAGDCVGHQGKDLDDCVNHQLVWIGIALAICISAYAVFLRLLLRMK